MQIDSIAEKCSRFNVYTNVNDKYAVLLSVHTSH